MEEWEWGGVYYINYDSPRSLSSLITQSKTNISQSPLTFLWTLLRGIGHKFNMAGERETISGRLRSSYIAPVSSSEFHVYITGIWF